ncbi:MAG: hypothetical protein HDS06_01785 [Bacteroides sp.]|nr:hypothetical protein [Bacteroides sp.]
MRSSTRLIVNTGAQYTRTLINLGLSLYSTRLILHALGMDDYGIFTLIAGVVSMLAFITNAMVSTTQRFMSYHQTRSNLETQQIIFGNSIILHLLFSAIVVFFLELASLFLFDGFLNIIPERIDAAKIVYQCAIAMIICSFMTSPFKALLISHENLVYTSIVEVVDGIIKVVIAWLLTSMDHDKLILYGYFMLGINLLNLFAFTIYDIRHYKECVLPKLCNFNGSYIKSMGSFVGWQLYSTGCIIGRTQGIAIILNRFFGTVINAAFGIALQVSASVNFISSALVTSINPQIVKAEGSGDRKKMFALAEAASKFSFLLLAMVIIPISFILPNLLKFWLNTVPEGSVLFCRVILYTALIDQITYGLGSANQAIGNIRPYALTVNTIKFLTVPCLWLLLYINIPLNIAIWTYPSFEFVCALCRIPFLKYSGGLHIWQFISNVFIKIILPFVFLVLTYWSLYSIGNILIYLFSSIPTTILYWIIIYYVSLNSKEKYIIDSIVSKIKI